MPSISVVRSVLKIKLPLYQITFIGWGMNRPRMLTCFNVYTDGCDCVGCDSVQWEMSQEGYSQTLCVLSHFKRCNWWSADCLFLKISPVRDYTNAKCTMLMTGASLPYMNLEDVTAKPMTWTRNMEWDTFQMLRKDRPEDGCARLPQITGLRPSFFLYSRRETSEYARIIEALAW